MARATDGRRGVMALADLTTPMAVRVAATLRIPDHIASGLRTAPELAGVTNTHAGALDRLLRHLGSVGLVRRDDDGRYTLTSLGEALREDHPQRMRARLDMAGAIGRADLAFVQLLHAVRTGGPAYTAQFGRAFWEDVAADPSLTASFDALMGCDVTEEAPDILAAYDWASLRHVVDVGGGNGSLIVALLAAQPALRGTVVDLPEAAEAARHALAAAGLAGRCAVVAGSFFDPLPPGADGYVLSAILHNWDDDAAEAILRRCAEAAGDTGAVFVIEQIAANGAVTNSARDLRMLVYFGGRERGVTELTALGRAAGLDAVAVHAAGPNSIVEFRRRRE
jgi:hypothetical protein